MTFGFERSAISLLLIAAVVAMLARRLKLPYSAGLVATGAVLAISPFSPTVMLTKELIYAALLPPLIFEAAFYLRWRELRRDFTVIIVLATLGVALSAGLTTVGMYYLAGWQWRSALIFGTLIAATDPVAVIAVFRESKIRGRLQLLVEAESLFNDGVAAVAFAIAVTPVLGQQLTAGSVMILAFRTIGGGVLAGAVVAGFILLLAGRTKDHLVELTFTTVAAYGSFLVAESFQVSGVLATLTVGLLLGNYGSLGTISDRGREALYAFWEYAAFLANSLVFLLIGMHEARHDFVRNWFPVMAAIITVTVSRAGAVYPACLLFARSSRRIALRQQHVLFCGGLRGALALALALGLPSELSDRSIIITTSFAVVAFSVFVQGLAIKPLLRSMGEHPAPAIVQPLRGHKA